MVSKAYAAYCRAYQAAFRVAVMALDWTEPTLLKGSGAVKQLPETIKEQGLSSILVVTDSGLTKLHLLDGFTAAMDEAGIKYVIYDGTQPNPTIDNIEEAHQMYLDNGCDGIVAFGGGSPMDCAKGAGARVVCPDKTVRQMRGQLKVRKKLPPLFAVPTTAGTGSETTIAAVVTDPSTHEKNAINDPVLRPKFAVLDPELTVGLPPKITAATGMDALTHAVEAYIGGSNTPSTRDNARVAVKLIYDNLDKAYTNGKDLEARENMLHASYCAGLAFTRAYVGYVHSIAHNLGAQYGLPHGLACAIVLPHVLDRFGFTDHPQLAELADVAGVSKEWMSLDEKAVAFIRSVKDFNARLGIPAGLDMLKDEDVRIIAERAAKEGNPLYPVPLILGVDELAALIRSMKI